MPRYCVYQCAGVVSVSRVNHHSRGFVDHYHIVVFVNNVERYILRLYGVVIVWSVKQKCYHIARFHSVIALNGAVVHMHESRFRRKLYAISRSARQVHKKKLVYSQKLLPLVGYHSEMLVQLPVFVSVVIYGVIAVIGIAHIIQPNLLLHSNCRQNLYPPRIPNPYIASPFRPCFRR